MDLLLVQAKKLFKNLIFSYYNKASITTVNAGNRFSKWIGTRNKDSFFNYVIDYCDDYMLFNIKWPILEDCEISDMQQKAFAEEFTEYIFKWSETE